jgi:hypothetical protein
MRSPSRRRWAATSNGPQSTWTRNLGSWWNLGFEAFGDIQSTPEALAATFALLEANGTIPHLGGERLSYPEWLDRL